MYNEFVKWSDVHYSVLSRNFLFQQWSFPFCYIVKTVGEWEVSIVTHSTVWPFWVHYPGTHSRVVAERTNLHAELTLFLNSSSQFAVIKPHRLKIQAPNLEKELQSSPATSWPQLQSAWKEEATHSSEPTLKPTGGESSSSSLKDYTFNGIFVELTGPMVTKIFSSKK